MTPTVSILVPVYNVSSYIERCAHSLFSQTFKDIEYIFVDDASPDDSMAILRRVMKQYPDVERRTIILRHPENQGLAKTRQTALFAATGKYISVVDSDDYIEPDMIEVLYRQLCAENASIAICDMLHEYGEYSEYVSDVIPDNKNDHFIEIVKAEHCLLNKLVKCELYQREDCTVPAGLNYFEDRHVMTRIYFYAEKITKVNRALYHYVQYNAQSLTTIKTRMHFENALLFWKLMEDFLREKELYDTCKEEMELSKVKTKCRLMADTSSCSLRKEYAGMLSNNEMKYLKHFKRGERLMLFLIHYHLFFLAHCLHTFSRYKNIVTTQISFLR